MAIARHGNRTRFFLAMSVVFLAVALTGFSTTYFIPLAKRALHAPPVIHVHGVLVFAWLLFFILQSSLVQTRRILTHRQLGPYGAALAVGVVVSGVAVGLHATRRDLGNGADPFVIGQMVNILIEMALFGGFVAMAVAWRRDGESHKRLLLLATISALAPAWLRLRHLVPVPNPFVTYSLLADSLLLVAIAADWITRRRIHPVYLWGGGIMVAVHLVELWAIESAPWQRLGRWLMEVPSA